jgi:Leucine-rich repeat (LRR) protein
MLNTLSLAGNRLRKLSGLENLTGLKQLNIEGNRVRWVAKHRAGVVMPADTLN